MPSLKTLYDAAMLLQEEAWERHVRQCLDSGTTVKGSRSELQDVPNSWRFITLESLQLEMNSIRKEREREARIVA